MKTNSLKWISYALASLILMQSCVVYQKTPATLDEAIATSKNVKIITTENDKYKFKQLVKEEGRLYGVSRRIVPKELRPYAEESGFNRYKILLPFNIKAVYPKDKRGSNIVTLSAIFIPVAILTAAIASASGHIGINLGG